ncbi:MAG: hypothetical protein ACHQ17_04995 [Polyangia bacterium]
MKRALFVMMLAGGCATQAPAVAPRSTTPLGAKTARPASAWPRLGWVAWDDPDTLVVCDRRVADDGAPIGVLGPCKKIGPDNVPHKLISWLNADQPDESVADASPFSACHLELDEMQLVPKPVPARAWLVGPSGKRTLLAEWTPDASVDGDRFRLEATFSPGGKWMALVELAIGVGEGERTLEIAGAHLYPTPACADAPRG